MATTINHLYQSNTLSATGTAEVLGRGSNTYTDTWQHSSVEADIGGWDKYSNFPTAVRTGNFVWVLYKIYDERAIWLLTDVVQDGYSLGNNIAYPEIPAHVKSTEYQFTLTSNAALYKANATAQFTTAEEETIKRFGTPSYAFTVSSHTTGQSSSAGYTNSFFYEASRRYNEIVYNGSGNGGFITSSNDEVPWLVGRGSAQYLLQDDGSSYNVPDNGNDYIYGIWPPFATKAQFETLYGTEAAWIFKSYDTNHDMLFAQAATQTNRTIVYSGDDPTIPYPFALPTFASNTLFKDIPGDTTGDGIDNTPSFEDALALTAVASIIECDGFPGDLIPGLDMEAINKKLNAAKAGIESAISSTGLLDLEKKLEGLKADIEDKFPKATKVLNFIEAIADLDLNNLAKEGIEAVKDNLKEEWRDAIDNVDDFVDGIIDSIEDFDICSLIGIKGKTGADGKLVKKPETPSIPDKDIERPVQSGYASTQSKGTAQTKAAGSAGITPRDLENANNALKDKWEDLSEDDQFSWGRKIEVGPQEGPRRTVIRDEIEFEAVLDENGEPVPKVRADGSLIRAIDPDAFGGGAPAADNDFSVSGEVDSVVRSPLQGSEVKIHGSVIGTVYHRNKYKNLYADGNGGGRFTGEYKNPLSPTPENDVSIFDIIKPPTVPGITDTDPETRKRVEDYLNLEGGGSPGAGNKLSEQAVSKTGPEWEKRLKEIQASKDYQTYVTALNNKVDPRNDYGLPGDSERFSRGGMSQESIDKLSADIQQVTIGLYIYREWKARFNYYKEKLKNSMLVDGKRGEYFPSTDYDITNKWKTYDELNSSINQGTTFYLNDVIPVPNDGAIAVDMLGATMTKKAADTVDGMDDEFITAIKKYFFSEEGVRLQQEIMMGQDPPFDEIIQKKLLDALVPNDNEGDPVSDNVAPVQEYNPKDETNSSGRVVNVSRVRGAARSGSVQPKLLSILEKSAAEAKYTLKIFSGGQVPAARGGRHKIDRYGSTKRHDDGYAVDIETYNESGRLLRVKAPLSDEAFRKLTKEDQEKNPMRLTKDTLAIRDFVIILLKNGITSVGTDDDYMNGDLHVDIANSNNGVAPIAHWGKGPPGVENRYSYIYAPKWLTTVFNGDYNKQYQEMLIRKEKEKTSQTNK